MRSCRKGHGGRRGLRGAGGQPGLTLPQQRGGEAAATDRRSAPPAYQGPARIGAGPTTVGRHPDYQRHLEGLQTARREIDRQVLPGDLSEENRLQALTTPMGGLFDALRMIDYRAETRLAAAFVPDRSRLETGRTLVKAMLFSDAGIVSTPSAETLSVRLPHQARRKIRPRTSSPAGGTHPDPDSLPGLNLRLVYEILPDDPGTKGESVGGSADPSKQDARVTPLASLIHIRNFGDHPTALIRFDAQASLADPSSPDEQHVVPP